MLDARLISAELLKLRRRRGMLGLAVMFTMGLVTVAWGVTAVQHASNPARVGPAGGIAHYRHALTTVEILVFVMGTIVGTTAGTQDLETGVFRDLAATGRARSSLFAARVGGALLLTLPIAAVTALLAGGGAVLLADGLPKPAGGDLAAGTVLILAAATLATGAGVGFGALVGSRGPVIGMLLGFLLAMQPLLDAMGLLGSGRALLPDEALARVGHLDGGQVHLGLIAAGLILTGWFLATVGLGAWRTNVREV